MLKSIMKGNYYKNNLIYYNNLNFNLKNLDFWIIQKKEKNKDLPKKNNYMGKFL